MTDRWQHRDCAARRATRDIEEAAVIGHGLDVEPAGLGAVRNQPDQQVRNDLAALDGEELRITLLVVDGEAGGRSVSAHAAPLIASRTLSVFSKAGLTFQAGPFGVTVGWDEAAALNSSADVSATAKQATRLALFGHIATTSPASAQKIAAAERSRSAAAHFATGRRGRQRVRAASNGHLAVL